MLPSGFGNKILQPQVIATSILPFASALLRTNDPLIVIFMSDHRSHEWGRTDHTDSGRFSVRGWR